MPQWPVGRLSRRTAPRDAPDSLTRVRPDWPFMALSHPRSAVSRPTGRRLRLTTVTWASAVSFRRTARADTASSTVHPSIPGRLTSRENRGNTSVSTKI